MLLEGVYEVDVVRVLSAVIIVFTTFLIFSISISEQLSEFDKAESIEVTVVFTCLSLPLSAGNSTQFAVPFFSRSIPSILSFPGFVGATKLLLFISSIALRN